jgi:hypothetical protein
MAPRHVESARAKNVQLAEGLQDILLFGKTLQFQHVSHTTHIIHYLSSNISSVQSWCNQFDGWRSSVIEFGCGSVVE